MGVFFVFLVFLPHPTSQTSPWPPSYCRTPQTCPCGYVLALWHSSAATPYVEQENVPRQARSPHPSCWARKTCPWGCIFCAWPLPDPNPHIKQENAPFQAHSPHPSCWACKTRPWGHVFCAQPLPDPNPHIEQENMPERVHSPHPSYWVHNPFLTPSFTSNMRTCPFRHILPTLQHLPDPILHVILGTSPTWPSPPLEHERYAHGAYLSYSTHSWPHPSLQHEKHTHQTCFLCLAHSLDPHPPFKHERHALMDVFFVFAHCWPSPPQWPHNHPQPQWQLHTGNKDNNEGEGGWAYKVHLQIFFSNSLVPTSPNPLCSTPSIAFPLICLLFSYFHFFFSQYVQA